MGPIWATRIWANPYGTHIGMFAGYARDNQYITFMNQWKHASRLNYSYFLNPTYKQTLTQLLQIKYNDMAIAEYIARKVIG